MVVAIAIGGWLGQSWLPAPPAEPVANAAASLAPTASPTTDASATPEPAAPASTPVASQAPVTQPTPAPTSPPAPVTATPELRAALDARLARFQAKTGIPGVSVAIVFPDGSTWRGSAGLADVATGRKVTADTAFPVASVSKTFTAALVLALVEDGRLALDTTVRTYLPTAPVAPATTVRQLLDHTSGLRDFFYAAGIDAALLSRPGRTWDANRSLSYVRKPYARPGTSWHYSNTNYLVLGMLAEAVGGAPVADQLRTRFLTPLGLEHTWYQAAERPRGPLAHGYRVVGPRAAPKPIDLSDGSDIAPFTSVVTASGAAGSIASTATDLARWARALYGGEALTAESRFEMVADVARTARLHSSIPYGLGVQAVSIRGRLTLGHSGRFLGSRAVTRWLPKQQLAIAVVTNQSGTDPNRLVAALLEIVLPTPTPAPICPVCPPAP